jgi:hypothetical protein
LLGEPASIFRSQSSHNFMLGPKLYADTWQYGPSFEEMYGCPQCLACGYHSVLHQLPWLQRCFVHDAPIGLANVRPVSLGKGLPRDLRFVHALLNLWFGNASPWPEARAHRWNIRGSIREHKRVTEMQNGLREIESKLSNLQKEGRSPPLFIARRGGNRILAWAHALECKKSKWEQYVANQRNSERQIFIACGAPQAMLVLARGEHWLSLVQNARRLECRATGERPYWLSELDELSYRMSVHHGNCEKSVEALARRWETEWFGQGLHDAAIRLYEQGVSPCRRLVFLEVLHAVVSMDLIVHQTQFRTWLNELLGDSGENDTAYQQGYVAVDAEAIFGLIRCEVPKRSGGPWRLPEDVRQEILTVSLSPPLARISDELLLAWVWAVGWTLYTLEKKGIKYSPYHEGRDVIDSFEWFAAKFMPSATIQWHPEGLILSVEIRTPNRLPSWSSLDRIPAEHQRRCVGHVNRLDHIFYERRCERYRVIREAIDQADRQLARIR